MRRNAAKRTAPVLPQRPAVARGIPAKVVDAILAVVTIDEGEITVDALLEHDLGMDSLDVCELALLLKVDDADVLSDEGHAGWRYVKDVMRAVEKAA